MRDDYRAEMDGIRIEVSRLSTNYDQLAIQVQETESVVDKQVKVQNETRKLVEEHGQISLQVEERMGTDMRNIKENLYNSI